jgi:hypothetical protein
MSSSPSDNRQVLLLPHQEYDLRSQAYSFKSHSDTEDFYRPYLNDGAVSIQPGDNYVLKE